MSKEPFPVKDQIGRLLSREPFPELKKLEELMAFQHPLFRQEKLGTIRANNRDLPLMGFCLGSTDPEAPTLGFTGGVHGLERVGAQVALTFLEYLCQQLSWNEDFVTFLKGARIAAIPIVNPGGLIMHRRSNPFGIDLMRNAPIEAEELTNFASMFAGGHRISPKLPYYRGPKGQPMQAESQALVDFMRKEVLTARFSIALDIHSGFGARDRLWYPYARTQRPFAHMDEVVGLKNLLDKTLRYHVYHYESQSHSYTTHGDLWDYLFFESFEEQKKNNQRFIPLTLEMGSWMWLKKNPLQIFSPFGLFNPIKVHRFNRIMRRHLPLLQFLMHATKNHTRWPKLSPIVEQNKI